MKRTFYSLLLIIGALLALNALAIEVGDTPHDRLGKLNGIPIKVSDFHGKVVIVSFWATWCLPCIKELPILSGIQKSAGKDELQVIAITHRESRKQYKRVINALGETPMILLHDASSYTARHYGVGGIPHMVIIGRDGKVAAVHVGYSEAALPALVAEINQIAAAR